MKHEKFDFHHKAHELFIDNKLIFTEKRLKQVLRNISIASQVKLESKNTKDKISKKIKSKKHHMDSYYKKYCYYFEKRIESHKEVVPSMYFITKDGLYLKSLHDLKQSLKRMSSEVFSHHVNKYRNDFKNWIQHAVGDKKLAQKVAASNSKESMRNLLIKETGEHFLNQVKKLKK